MEGGESPSPKRVCIIGAGVSGLLSIKYLRESKGLVGMIFEQTDRVGGLWHYVQDTERDVNGLPVHSAAYAGLRGNLAKEFLQLEGLDFPDYENGASYVSHSSIQKYLIEYAEKFKLREYIQFNSKVMCVKPGPDGIWDVSVQNFASGITEHYKFDAVIVANGKFWEPHIPEILGLSEFQGSVKHTKSYRTPEQYKDQNVVLLGLGPSAVDIGTEISKVAKNVTIVHRTEFEIKLYPKNMRVLKSNIKTMRTSSVLLDDGTELPCDSLILATGYNYSYPFLHPDCGITVEEGKYVRPLYKHMLSVQNPTLCILSLFSFTGCWLVSEYQVQYFLHLLEGGVRVPSLEERWGLLEEQERELDENKVPIRHRHMMGFVGKDVFPYLDGLAQDGGFLEFNKKLGLRRKEFYYTVARVFQAVVLGKRDRVRWLGPDSFTYYCHSEPEYRAEAPEELLTVAVHEGSGEVIVTSSLGTVHNRPFADL